MYENEQQYVHDDDIHIYSKWYLTVDDDDENYNFSDT